MRSRCLTTALDLVRADLYSANLLRADLMDDTRSVFERSFELHRRHARRASVDGSERLARNVARQGQIGGTTKGEARVHCSRYVARVSQTQAWSRFFLSFRACAVSAANSADGEPCDETRNA